jgi:hypothetical protein
VDGVCVCVCVCVCVRERERERETERGEIEIAEREQDKTIKILEEPRNRISRCCHQGKQEDRCIAS